MFTTTFIPAGHMMTVMQERVDGISQDRIIRMQINDKSPSMEQLADEVLSHHFANPPASPSSVLEFEMRVGWHLDDELRAFYLRCDGAVLFDMANSAYRILPLSKIVRARLAMRG